MARSVIFAEDFERGGTSQVVHNEPFANLNALLLANSTAGALASNVITLPAGTVYTFGHADWADGTVQTRFVFATGTRPTLFWHVSPRSAINTNSILGQVIGTSLNIQKQVGGVNTAALANTAIAALTNATAYWLQMTSAGTTYTVSLYNDSAGALGSLIATATATITDGVLQNGCAAFGEYANAAGLKWGGAFANVCTVSQLVPAGWTFEQQGGDICSGCCDAVNPYSGLRSVSIYYPTVNSNGDWKSPAIPVVSGRTYTIALQNQGPAGAAINAWYFNDSVTHFNATQNFAAVWTPASMAIVSTQTSAAAFLIVRASNDAGVPNAGTYYWDNIAIYLGTPSSSQPTILRVSGRSVAKFGNATLPNGQGVMPQIDLNDYVNTVLGWLDGGKQIGLDEANRQIGLEQFLYLARSTYVSDDFGPRPISIPLTYFEDATHFLGGFLAAIEQAGEQQLTFDNLTYIAVKHAAIASRVTSRWKQPLAWDFLLNLIAAEPWFKDLVASAMLPLTLTVDAGQSFVIPYQGTVRCIDEVWTLSVPVSNSVAINSMVLSNLMSGEALTINFLSYLAIPASTARVITIDCGASTVVDDLGHAYDFSGTFPHLFPAMRQPVTDQLNPFQVVIVPASGATAGLTLACAWTPRWKI